jgi:cytochrome c oxidase assembly protein subunit 15
VRLGALVLLGIPAQALLGGVTVLTDLNPWVVGCHFLLSMGIIAAAYAFWRSTWESDDPVEPVVPRPLRQLAAVLVGIALAVLAVGTVVTGSGPHAGDENAKRTGLDPAGVAQLHADLVFLLLGVSVAVWFALRAVDAPPTARRAATVLIGVELAQGVVGFVQYATGLPELAVGLHMAGACAVWLAAQAVWYATGTRRPSRASDAEAQGDVAPEVRLAITPSASTTTPTPASARNGAR